MVPRIFSCAAASLAAAIFPAICAGGIIGTTGAVQVISPPSNVTIGKLESNTAVNTFVERQGFSLPTSVAVDITNPGTSPTGSDPSFSPATIGTGTLVNSYYMHFDAVGEPSMPIELSGSITFSEPILGLIVGVKEGQAVGFVGNTLDLSNPVLGVPGTSYGFEAVDIATAGVGADSVTFSADRKTVDFDWFTGPSADNMRIVTQATPEPGTLSLIGLGALGLMMRRRRSL